MRTACCLIHTASAELCAYPLTVQVCATGVEEAKCACSMRSYTWSVDSQRCTLPTCLHVDCMGVFHQVEERGVVTGYHT